MKERRVRFTATARRHVEREHAYWRAHRDYPDLFPAELEGAVRILALMPGAGYYTFDDSQVIVRALWGARRERGPVLR